MCFNSYLLIKTSKMVISTIFSDSVYEYISWLLSDGIEHAEV